MEVRGDIINSFTFLPSRTQQDFVGEQSIFEFLEILRFWKKSANSRNHNIFPVHFD